MVRAIAYQQLAEGVAHAIHGRLLQVLRGVVQPEAVLALSQEELRGAGLSAAKASSVVDLATRVLEGTLVLEPRKLARQTDDQVMRGLTSVRGVGPWTAQMFMLFRLRRLDIWPAGGLGIRRGYGLAWAVPTPS
jgi:DNA-3-methyladenine glycosylase II